MNALARSRASSAVGANRSFFSPARGRNRSKSSKSAPAVNGAVMDKWSAPLTLTAIEFCGWLGQAEPGDTISYHRGFLVLDRAPSNRQLSNSRRAELDLLATCAMRASEYDLVHLVQRRNAPLDFSYLAIARPRAKKTPVNIPLPTAEASS
jgi:hypothetical protein